MTGHRLLVLGGARSGKSRLAQSRAEQCGGTLTYVATAEAWDDEMRERIALHQADRDARWSTLEAPLDLPAAIAARSAPGETLLVDCLTLWATNVLLAERDLDAEITVLVEAVTGFRGTLILVANEVGLGIVPDNALARRFRDFAGRINQAVAAAADEVIFVAAGLPLQLK
ncbi:bifunctional adenosylcobinamide kinase/adenosylcobinamide-phosphate guanylyltransferase [Novosphingobium sp. JCM 18896]|uniref:bifunctional adenosylcobinamide kinase/adenosylcobinamide-phosphate guanylyltransferase n=1 Tax=Novosphingobium sp. JCM 18896 TaxID=2989731 RepID=UPI002221AAD7|nr:bifunctional adenosylcobinamide kinase/adenosylcobinamide-phosphate guanylyltransferase [Novosphingobium sp. JCM 18896]MCW1427479.1 bifunctional adenosylcobinamide kinase/adenosylcobinamide-phosphate guanylyltransferase [Novosphingobium sp. JCM 18896]